MHTKGVNGTKITSRNAFIDNLVGLKSEKELKKEERKQKNLLLRLPADSWPSC